MVYSSSVVMLLYIIDLISIPSTLFGALPYLSPFSSWLTMYTTVFNRSWGCGPDEEALLPNVEVDVAADLVRHICTEVAADDAVPHTLVLLLEWHLHVRSNQLYKGRRVIMGHGIHTFSELEVSRALVASLTAKSLISSSIKHSLIVGLPRLIFI